MTVPVSVSLPSASATKVAATGGVASGKSRGPDGAAAEASGVADMFAALVATLTAQMQPSDGEGASGVTEGAVEGETPAATAEGFPRLALGRAPTAGESMVGAPPAANPLADPVEHAIPGKAQPLTAEIPATAADVPDVTLEAAPQPAVPASPAAQHETEGSAVVPAVAGSARPRADHAAVTLPATPAVPAQPASRVDPDAPAPSVAEQAGPPARTGPAAATVVAPAANPAVGDAPHSDAAPAPVTNAALTAPASARTEAPTPIAAPPAAPPADPHVQVARVVRPLRLSSDGAYDLALDLTPEELGRVRIDVELRGTTISLNLRADNPATRELLQDSLQQLRRELEAAGLQAGNLDVGGRGPDGRSSAGQEHRGAPAALTSDEDATAEPMGGQPAADTLTDETVDVRA